MGEMTHSAECYKVHHACAVAEIKRLRARVAELEARPIDRERLVEAIQEVKDASDFCAEDICSCGQACANCNAHYAIGRALEIFRDLGSSGGGKNDTETGQGAERNIADVVPADGGTENADVLAKLEARPPAIDRERLAKALLVLVSKAGVVTPEIAQNAGVFADAIIAAMKEVKP